MTTKLRMKHLENHRTHRIGWLLAAVLGANDDIVSVASLMVGVDAGEYVSVSPQSDTERADLDRERMELATDSVQEHAELAAIYVDRGLDAQWRFD